ncbi:hypothetical protein [Thermofilum pendens]|uniref:PaREP6 n=1 Tax=Thermofilum pendens (strain DSM 2475 / Hrk 5) TaxID=368408 RepID=A1RZS5_THEPD|nr:hypothetical protein [Thermofilum pendens]ABL78705.1 paREP6 [Thermofilum pendens Hrk 5]
MRGESLDDVVREYLEEEREAREIRRRMADWEFIERQPPRVRAALKLYVEKGDIRLTSRIAGMNIDEFRELLRKARIPVVV